MDTELKRRTFLTAIIGGLLGTPLAVRFFHGDQQGELPHRFTQELSRLRSLLDVPIRSTEGPDSLKPTLAPPVGQSWNYVIFAPPFFPQDLSHALDGEPDLFLAREGRLSVQQTNRNQIVLSRRDSRFGVFSPWHTEEREKHDTVLLFRDGAFHIAQPKGSAVNHPDGQFSDLLSLPESPKTLSTGNRWKSNTGRVKPFQNCPTEYEVTGFADVAGQKTLHIRFKGNIPNIARLPGVNSQQPDNDARMTNTHEGDAYFDTESGLLVRQEVRMTSVCQGNHSRRCS